MSLITLRYEEHKRLGVKCEVLINPATEHVYIIAYFRQHDMWMPMQTDRHAAGPQDLRPIPIAGQPDMVHACATEDEARIVVEVYDAQRQGVGVEG